MKPNLSFQKGKPTIIAALHLPPSPASGHPAAVDIKESTDFALANAAKAVKVGIPALYIQDLGDFPINPHVQPDTIARLSVIGAAVRREFPDLALGVCLMAHAAKEPLAIADAIQAQFVRIKVYVGAMVRAEGLLEGCAHQAISYRHQLQADDIKIFADVYDRTGQPLGRMPIEDEARQALVMGRADGVILTGLNVNESQEMLKAVDKAQLGQPLILGGGANVNNLAQFAELCNGIIVSSAFKTTTGWTREAMTAEWDLDRMRAFMDAWNHL
ncbi:MAG TPA: BtpA/SgcQ family protein [Anaerolineaceae bacterium]|nr:BtpA/SgcQ family protein [Anaerolineaceae bacterium]